MNYIKGEKSKSSFIEQRKNNFVPSDNNWVQNKRIKSRKSLTKAKERTNGECT